METHKLSQEVNEIILDSWRDKTKSRYDQILKKWHTFSQNKNENGVNTNVSTVLEFLNYLYRNGCGYSSICIARSALASTVILSEGFSVSEHPLVKRFVKGIFNRCPPQPRYSDIWDINKVLLYYVNKPRNSELIFKDLSKKIVTLLLLLSSRRKNAIYSIDVNNVLVKQDKLILLPHKTLKETRPGHNLQPIIYDAFQENPNLCIVNCMEVYLQQRSLLIGKEESKLIITFGKPHRSASEDTISRWIKDVLREAGIDVTVYTTHSVRSASTSKAHQTGITRAEILKKAGWSNETTFIKHYKRDIIGYKFRNSYDNQLLKQFAD